MLVALTLAACSSRNQEQQQARAAEARDDARLPKVLCASGRAPMQRVCTAERTHTAQGWVITMRHPDGHFRRLLVKGEGVVEPADGAEKADIQFSTAEGLTVTVGGDRYSLPTISH